MSERDETSGAPQRKLECGCWQALLRGSMLTKDAEMWVTIYPCAEHASAPADAPKDAES